MLYILVLQIGSVAHFVVTLSAVLLILVLHFLQCCTFCCYTLAVLQGAWLVVEVGVSVVGTTTTLARGRDLVGRGGGHSSSSVVVNQPQF